MDPAVATTIVALLGALSGIVTVWLQNDARRTGAREKSRRDHLRRLPQGSRVIDLGKRGIVIEVGTTAGREAPLNDER
ncbi:hypothetical protein ACIBEJ_33930 [Nonomuraea sp. NPDC050790]|uniref:hypothetical protein n=1 Tax=Nonomuraea sp. NPDC050790 TaxID=3364371 RepID=UPI0037AB6416